MAKLGEGRYYKRSGDAFYKMEHYDIADMFGKRNKPKLLLMRYDINPQDWTKNIRVIIYLGIKNLGRGLAKFPYLGISKPENCHWNEHGIDGNLVNCFIEYFIEIVKEKRMKDA